MLLDFDAEWCPTCKALNPIIEKVDEAHSDKITIAKVDVDQNKDLAQQFNVKSIPSLFFIKNSEIKEKVIGVLTEQELKDKIKSYR